MPLSKAKKELYVVKLTALLQTYTKVFFVQVDNVGSQQMHDTRMKMRGKAEILMGKNTLIRKVLKDFMEANPGHPIGAIEAKINGNVGLVFTNSDLGEVKDLILSNRVPAPARAGAMAPVDVVVPAGSTGCDPGQTSFFQVLQIPTKIQKGQIEITVAVELIKAGNKVGASEAALLTKLGIRPFSYGLVIESVYDNGSIFSAAVLAINKNVIVSRFTQALNAVAAISLQIGYPTQASIPHSVGNAFKACVAIVVGLETFTFDEAKPFQAFLADPSAFAGASSSGASGPTAAPVAAAPVVVEEEVDALAGGMDMFGGDEGGGGGDY
jgi:large subunit ribosomal protein LP0